MQSQSSNQAVEVRAGMSAGEAMRRLAEAFERAGLWFGHGTACAQDEAGWLVGSIVGVDYGLPPPELDAVLAALPDHVLSADEAERVSRVAAERIERRAPLAYLLGEAWFAGLPFAVDPRVLVPRSPIAELIQDRFTPWVDPDRVSRVLEIGTGSGCIAIATALALPGARVDATDVSAGALAVARENVMRHGVEARVTLIESDLFDAVAPAHYDLIVTNPPYVDASEMRARPPEYRHEPEIGLAAGEDGLDVVRRLLAAAADWLTPDGALIVEVGVSEEALQRAYPTVPFVWLEFEHGGHGVFVLSREDLDRHRSVLRFERDAAVR